MGITRLSAKSVAVIVAHPDDETLWAGGTILSHPEWKWFIVSLCRRNDEDRSLRFYRALKILKSEGIMGDLDDGPEQRPLQQNEVKDTILKLLPANHFDLIISHNPIGEYTRHLRHEEAGRAVINLWNTGKISTSELWTFAYTDNNKKHYPVAMENASIRLTLAKRMWMRKYGIITQTYGFENSGFEAETTPRVESFWQFTDPVVAEKWLNQLIKPKN
jgi:LmbE family N-acetylglucosaminyl deacetylase